MLTIDITDSSGLFLAQRIRCSDECQARERAQRLANERSECVYLSESDSSDEEEISPNE